MANVKMGFEGQLFYGPADASQADVNLTNVKDITLTYDVERGDITVRGGSTVPPIKLEAVTMRSFSVEWGMINDKGTPDAELALLLTAATDGTLVAIYLKDYSSGAGPDFDATLSVSWGLPLSGEQTITFTAVPSVVRSAYA